MQVNIHIVFESYLVVVRGVLFCVFWHRYQ